MSKDTDGQKSRGNDGNRNAASRIEDHARRHLKPLLHAMLRGGRITKYHGVVASYAPQLGLVEPVGESSPSAPFSPFRRIRGLLRWSAAPAALLALASTAPVQAQDACIEISTGNFTCQDLGAPATTTQEMDGRTLDIRIEDGFAVDTSATSGNALTVTSDGSAGEDAPVAITQIDGTSTLTGSADGINVYNSGGGVTITTGGAVTGDNGRGIYVAADVFGNAVGGSSVINTSAGTVTGGTRGIEIIDSGDDPLTLTVDDVIGEAAEAIRVLTDDAAADITVQSVSGEITGATSGMILTTDGADITVDGFASVTGLAGHGINADVGDAYGNYGKITITDVANITGYGDTVTAGPQGHGILADARYGDISIQRVGVGDGNLVEGRDGDGINVYAYAGEISIGGETDSATGAVIGAIGNVTASRNGIIAINDISAGDITINTSAGAVTGGYRGIDARQYGNGDVSITAHDVTVLAGGKEAILVQSDSSESDVTVTTTGTVQGATDGIYVDKTQNGSVIITTADVTGASGHAIRIHQSDDGNGSIYIDSSAGTLTGSVDGLFVEQLDDDEGHVTIKVDDVAGGQAGIRAIAQTGATEITLTSTAEVEGDGGAGIDAQSTGGAITVQGSSGEITGATDGVYMRTGGGVLTVQNLDSITGEAGDGIDADSDGGNILISNIDKITGTDGHGIRAISDNGNVSIQGVGLNGGVTGTGTAYDGIYVSSGTGSIDIGGTTAIGDITGGRHGIEAYVEADGGALTIDSSAGSVAGGTDGVQVLNNGTGATSITTAGVTGTTGYGVFVGHSGASLSIDTSAGTVTGGRAGIAATNSGTGDLSVTTANVTSTGANADAIRAANASSDGRLIIDTSAGIVKGTRTGINADNFGSGATVITVNDVTGYGAEGISASSTQSTADITVQGSSGEITGATDGINISTSGADIVVDNLDSVTGEAGDGIDASSGGGAITISDIGTILGTGGNGILADSDDGDISIQGVGLVGGVTGTGDTDDGISAYAGTGSIDIGGTTAIGNVTGDAYGIDARVALGGGDITIDSSSGTVTGEDIGIHVQNAGAGAVSITSAAVNGDDVYGIYAYAAGTNLSIDSSAGAVTGGQFGIYARNLGSGATSITAADTTSYEYVGISAYTASTATTLEIDSSAGTVTGSTIGIEASHLGSGDVTITVDDVTGEGAQGILASGAQSTADITVKGSSGDVEGATDGIKITTVGADIVVDNFYSVTGQAGDGIDIESAGGDVTITNITNVGGDSITTTPGNGIAIDSSGGNISIQNVGVGTGNLVEGGDGAGIYADTNTLGAASIDIGGVAAVGNIKGSTYGIYASNSGIGDITVNARAGSVTGEDVGVDVNHSGTGNISVTTANVTSSNGHGLDAYGEENVTGISINTVAGYVKGGDAGVSVSNEGSGALSVVTGDVTGLSGYGITVQNAATSTSLTIDSSAGEVRGSTRGIHAAHNGSGDVIITVNDVTGYADAAIHAVTTQGTSSITVQGSSGVIEGAADGIYVRTAGDEIAIRNLDSVTGNAGDGLDLASAGGAITISNIGTILGTGGHGVLADSDGGDISIQGSGFTGGIEGTGGHGISADARGGTGGDIAIGTEDAIGDVAGIYDGIYARTNGSGSVAIVADGDVSGEISGVSVNNEGAGAVSVAVSGTTYAGLTGIEIDNSNGGSVTLETGGVQSRFYSAIEISNDAGTTTTVTVNDDITSGSVISAGIDVRNDNGGDIAVTAYGDITTRGDNYGRGDAILAQTSTGDIAVEVSGNIRTGTDSSKADSDGINLQTSTGDISITSTGDIVATGSGADAVVAEVTTSGTIDINLSGDSVSGAIGIDSDATTGATEITIGSDTDVQGTTGHGIDSRATTGAITVQGSSGTITGALDGINSLTMGGNIQITSLDSVTGQAGDGIDTSSGSGAITISNIGTIVGTGGNGIQAESSGGDISIQAVGLVGGVTGTGVFDDGISARANDGGSILIGSVTAVGNVTGEKYGITAYAADTAVSGDIIIDSSSGTVAGGDTGILAQNLGAGAVSITSAAVKGDAAYGIYAFAEGTNLTIDSSAGAVTGGEFAIWARNLGSGATSITVANATGDLYAGVRATTGSATTTLQIDSAAGTVTGNTVGIEASHLGSGDVTITVDDVTGKGAEGILASSAQSDANITVQGSSGEIVGATDGIKITTAGADIVVNNLDSVTGQAGDGLDLSSSGGAISVSDIDTIRGAARHGIVAYSDSGSISVQGSGLVGGITGVGGAGILAYAAGTSGTASDGNIDIGGTTAIGDVTGAVWGIRATTRIGSIMIDSSEGSVTGSTAGIWVQSLSQRGVSITTADVTSSTFGAGVTASSRGGGVTIDSSAGTVTGGSFGINASDSGAGDLALTVDDVYGRGAAAIMTSAASGTTVITLTSTADVTSLAAAGISAISTGSDADITIQGSSGSVTGNTDGITTRTLGADIVVRNLDSVTGNGGSGIDAASSGGDITIANITNIIGYGAATTTGATGFGILANADAGNISIQNVGVGTEGLVGGGDGSGIQATSSGGDINIGGVTAIGNVSGSDHGINAEISAGTGTITIDTSSGLVRSGGLDGIAARNLGMGNVYVAAGSVYAGNNGIQTYTTIGTTEITISAGAAIDGGSAAGVAASSVGGDLVLQGLSGSTISGQDQGVHMDSDGGEIMIAGLESITGNMGNAIDATSTGDAITISGVGTVNGFNASGIDVTSGGGAISIQGTGLIGGISGGNGSGILADATGGAGGDVNIGGTTANGRISAAGGAGVAAQADGEGDVTVAVSAVTTTGNNAIGISAANVNGDIRVESSGAISTSGAASEGVDAQSTSGAVSVSVAGITTKGFDSEGVDASSDSGTVTVTATGLISTEGEESDGVEAENLTGDIIVNVAAISTTGDYAAGVQAENNTGAIRITATGAISTTGLDSNGVNAGTYAGEIEISVADVTTTTSGSSGILATSYAGDVSVESSGTIAVSGEGATGVLADSYNGNVTVDVNNVEATGVPTNTGVFGFAGGIFAFAPEGEVAVTATGTVATDADFAQGVIAAGAANAVVEVNNVATEGNFASALLVTTRDGPIEITANGNITTEGISSTGINADGYGAVTVEAVNIATLGANSNAIYATSYGNYVKVATTGTISTAGADSDGIEVYAYSGNATITSSGAVTTQGNGSDAILVVSVDGNIDITSTGPVSTAGTAATGIYAGTGDAGTIDLTIDDVTATNSTAVLTRAQNGRMLITLRSTADVTGGTGAGIDAASSGSYGDIIIQGSSGNVTGGTDGIRTLTRGADITVQDLDSVIGNGGSGLDLTSNGGDITISNIGTIYGQRAIDSAGIRALSDGGTISIQGSGLVGGIGSANMQGIYVRSGTGDIHIGDETALGDIAGFGFGIDAQNAVGGGAIIIDTSGGTTGSDTTGIYAINRGTGVLDITAADIAASSLDGIDARHLGTGAIRITTENIIAGFDGISVSGGVSSGAITVDTSAGTVLGGQTNTVGSGGSGIVVTGNGTGEISVTTADVTTNGFAGIAITSNGGASPVVVDSTAGAVSGRFGIIVTQRIDEAVTITTGDVTGTYADGIAVELTGNGDNSSDTIVDSRAGSVTAAGTGISVNSQGTGKVEVRSDDVTGNVGIVVTAAEGTTDITLTSTALVRGTDGPGIVAMSTGRYADIAITGSSGDVIGASDGMYSRTAGADISVTNLTSVTGQAGDGIDAASAGGAISITNIDTIAGTGGTGLLADSDGGAISVQGVGRTDGVTGTAGAGIFADASGGAGGSIAIGTDLAVGNVSGATEGIRAVTDGSGSIAIDTSTGSVSGDSQGISTRVAGTGNTTITTADVSGGDFDGIYAYVASTATGLTIDTSAGTVTGGDVDGRGITALNFGAGATAITAADVTGYAGDGIFALGNGSTLTVDSSAGTVTGADQGIEVSSSGTGPVQITVGDVTGQGAEAIRAVSTQATANISIQGPSADIVGATDGIYSRTAGADISVSNMASVIGQAGSGLDLDTTDGGASGAAITVSNITGAIEGRNAVDADGIHARSGTGDITIRNIGSITGANDGLDLATTGGAITVNAIGSVTGQTGDALHLVSSGGSITVTEIGTINGYGNGIFADAGSGSISIQDVGLVGGITASNGAGIAAYADNGGSINIGTSGAIGLINGTTYGVTGGTNGGGNIIIDVRDFPVTGANGVAAENVGTGYTAIFTAAVTGTAGNGIEATNNGTTLAINAFGAVAGANDGIRAANNGTGTTAITTAAVTGTAGTGVHAHGSAASSGLTINSLSGAVSGYTNGMEVYHAGSGALRLDSANVTGATQTGISATAASNSDGLFIDTTDGTVTGATHGIIADNQGTGATVIESANVSGTAGDGLTVLHSGTSLTIDTTGSVSGANGGISATNNGSGITRISATGTVTGTAGNGIAVTGGGTGSAVTLNTAAAVAGGENGIFVDAGTGDLTLEIGGDVTGGENGIHTYAENGTRLTLAVGQTISGDDFGVATMTRTGSSMSNDVLVVAGTVNGDIGTFEGDDSVSIAATGTVSGEIALGSGDDRLDLDGNAFVSLLGGEGNDILNFNATGTLISSGGTGADNVAGFEIYNFNNGGYRLAGSHTGLMETSFNAGENIWLGALDSTRVTISSGAVVQVAQGASLTGNLVNSGTVGINATGAGAFNITGDFTQGADAILALNVVNTANFDQLVVSGNVVLDGTLALTQTAFGSGELRLIDGGTALDGVFANVTGLGGALVSQEIVYDSDNFDVLLVSTINEIGTTGLVDGDDISVATDISSGLSDGTLNADLESLVLGIGLIDSVPVLENALRELRPEVSVAGLEVFRSSQNLFLDRLAAGSVTAPTQPVETAALDGRLYAPVPKSGGKHIWGNVQYVRHVQDGTLSNPDYAADSFELAAGVSGIELGDVTFGFALGYSDIDTKEQLAAPDRSQIEVFRAGAIASAPMNTSGKGLNAHVDGMLSFAAGTNTVNMNVAIPAVGYAAAQSGEGDIHYIGAGLRVTLDGFGDKDWLVKPHLMVAWDNVYQGSMTIGEGATALVTGKGDFDRTTFGYGLSMNHQWTGKTRLHASLTGYHFVGDTQIGFGSSFANNSAATSFVTTGEDVRHQYVVESGVEHDFGRGWSLSADAFAEFGDLQAYGGMFKLTKRF
ncbi:autotransporter outer membrane beta-barrel domain-containing protein [Parasphingorhabdus marina]|uniref:autotransporter outer membrane beta-barrel domain-containing protein n=1 Tax=Parasphingorhabdus marina TaxID=394732 RepID=UPI001161487A|nr:autotransporter outer membrane beta-barrel domain-containing protein [Parasphingorhabdus marina]